MLRSIFDGLSVVSLDETGLTLDGTELTVQQLLDSSLIQNTVTINDHNVSSSSLSVDTLNSNYTSISVIDDSFSFHEEDLFQCGRCKLQFSSLEAFMVHKRSQCSHLKLKKEPPNEVTVEASTAVRCDSQQALNHVSSSIPHNKDPPGVELPEEQNEKFNVSSLTTAAPDTQSVGVNDGEYFNLTLENAQVLINEKVLLNEGLELSAVDTGKMMDSKGDETLFPGTATLIPEGDTEIAARAPLGCSMVKADPGSKDAEEEAKTEVMDSSSISPSEGTNLEEEEEGKTNYNHVFFHGRMAKGMGDDKELVKLRTKHHCTFCDKAFSKNFDLQQHIRSHTGEKPFQCIVCGRAFAQKSNVKKHMATHKVWPKDSICNTLPKEPIKKVLSIPAGDDDMNDSGSAKEEVLVDNSYVCPFCNVVHASYLELRSHMKEHKDQKVYRCIQKGCEETYMEMETFLEHTRTHDKELQYRCHTCSKLFNSLHSLGFHQFEHSIYPWPKKSGPSYFRCTKCMNKYASAEALDHHLKMTKHHFPCKQCSRIFTSERLLRTHLRVHGNINLFTCSTCCKDLKSEHSLKMHQLIHTGERPFECQICNLSFNRKDKLKRHMLVHEPKKFKCPFSTTLGCQREFSRNDKLRLHLLSHAHSNTRKHRSGKNDKRENSKGSQSKKGTPVPGEKLGVTSDPADEDDLDAREKDRGRLKRPPQQQQQQQQQQEGDFGQRHGVTNGYSSVECKRVLKSVRRNKLKIEQPLVNENSSFAKIKVKKHSISLHHAKEEVVSENIGQPALPLAEARIETGCESGISISIPEKLGISTPVVDTPCHPTKEVTYDSLTDEVHKLPDDDDEFIVSYNDDGSNKLGQGVQIIYIPFDLAQNEFLDSEKSVVGERNHLLTAQVDNGSNSLSVNSSITLQENDSSPSPESYFVTSAEIEDLDNISAEILLTEPNLQVIHDTDVSESTMDNTDDVGSVNNSFFVVKGVDPQNDSMALSFEDTRTIILQSKEPGEVFCV